MYKNIPKFTMLLAIFLYFIGTGTNLFVNVGIIYIVYMVVPLLGLIGAIVSNKIEGNPFMLINIIIIFAPIIIAYLYISIFGFV